MALVGVVLGFTPALGAGLGWFRFRGHFASAVRKKLPQVLDAG